MYNIVLVCYFSMNEASDQPGNQKAVSSQGSEVVRWCIRTGKRNMKGLRKNVMYEFDFLFHYDDMTAFKEVSSQYTAVAKMHLLETVFYWITKLKLHFYWLSNCVST